MNCSWGTTCFPCDGKLHPKSLASITDQGPDGFPQTGGKDGKEDPRGGGELNCSHNFKTPAIYQTR